MPEKRSEKIDITSQQEPENNLPDPYKDYFNSLVKSKPDLSKIDIDINSLIKSLKENLESVLSRTQKGKLLSLLNIAGIKDNPLIKSKLVEIDYLLDLKNSNPEDIKKHITILLLRIQGIFKNNPNQDLGNILSTLKQEILGANDQIETKGMSTTNNRIKEITSTLSHLEDTFIIDILKSKIQNNESFTYNIFYSNKELLEKFISILKRENISIENIKKYVNFINSEVSNHFIWVRDNSINVTDSKGNPIIIEPLTSRMEEKAKINNGDTDILAAKKGIDIIQSDLIFQGGNIRQTNEYVFIGSDDILINAMDTKSLDDNLEKINGYTFDDDKINEVIQKYEKLFGKKIIPIGMRNNNGKWEHDGKQEQQYGFHIDLYITPLGGKEIAVRENTSKKIINDLKNNGFNIYFIGNNIYNNVLIENYTNIDGNQVKKVYLPQYFDNIPGRFNKHINSKLQESNQKALNEWGKTGFEIMPIRVDIGNIKLQGSLNCRTNEIRE